MINLILCADKYVASLRSLLLHNAQRDEKVQVENKGCHALQRLCEGSEKFLCFDQSFCAKQTKS